MNKLSPAVALRGRQNNSGNLSGSTDDTRTKNSRKLTKTLRILAILSSGKSLNMFEAERIGDHTLRSTVSTIQKKYEVCIHRKYEKVKTRLENKTPVCRYWIAKQDFTYAREIVASEFIARGLAENFYAAYKRIEGLCHE